MASIGTQCRIGRVGCCWFAVAIGTSNHKTNEQMNVIYGYHRILKMRIFYEI